MYNLDDTTSSSPIIVKLFSETLFMCLDFRNRAAHGGRVYNFEPRDTAFLLNDPYLLNLFRDLECWKDSHGVAQLLALLSCFTYLNPYNTIDSSLSEEINRHLSTYPQDQQLIENIMGMDIIHKKIIWISPKTNIFHIDPYCSGIKNYIKVTFDDDDFHFTHLKPCKKCCKDFFNTIN